MSALKKSLQVYDPGLGEASDKAIDKLISIYGLEDVEFPSVEHKRVMICGKCDRHINKVLERLGLVGQLSTAQCPIH